MSKLTLDSRLSLQRIVTNARVHKKQGAVPTRISGVPEVVVGLGDPGPGKMPESDAPPPKQPFLIMNPRSGGGKVGRFALKAKAEALGAEVALLEGPEVIDVGLLAREAVAAGADLLGVAGGDVTQALVAGIAAEHDIPLLVISAGTRNHFALDLGLDREDPSRCLDALADGVELKVDLRFIGERPFVNNASFGAVRQPWSRARPTATTRPTRPHRGWSATKARRATAARPDDGLAALPIVMARGRARSAPRSSTCEFHEPTHPVDDGGAAASESCGWGGGDRWSLAVAAWAGDAGGLPGWLAAA